MVLEFNEIQWYRGSWEVLILVWVEYGLGDRAKFVKIYL